VATTQAIDVVMPQMGVSVSEGTITKWLKQEGEPIAADEPLLEISTDKVDTEVPSPGEGVVQQILVSEGETVEVGTKLAVIAPEGAEVAAPEPPAPEPEAQAEPEPEPEPERQAPPEPATQEAAAEAAAPSSSEGETPTAAPAPTTASAPAETPAPAAAPADTSDGAGERTFVSPVVARIASEHGVDVGQVQGTGRGGRVTKKDIMSFVESGGQAAAPTAPPEAPPPAAEPAAPAAAPEPEPAPPAPEPAPAPAAAPAPQAAPSPPKPAPAPEPVAAGTGETIEPMNAMRRGIAEHMRRSLDTSAHVTTVFEIDLSKVVAIRNKLKPEYQKSYGVNPTYLAFIARATIEAMKNWPWVNAEIRGEQIVRKNYVNLGIAVALEGGQGLIVPVVKNAEGLNLLGLARAIADIADRARNKKLTPDDVQGGTFTITNPGGWGAIIGTPIISQPQVAILDVEALVKRPVVVQDESGQDVIAIRPMMNLCLSYDHRLVDGAYAAQFMKELRENLETFDEGAY
jgi:pyruvate dehydrogenase E2 component (dihydrolipoyllysine-residue acetyltransferase)